MMNSLKKWSFFVACHIPIAAQFQLAMDKASAQFRTGSAFPDQVFSWGYYFQERWLPLLALCLTIGLIGFALKERKLEPMERYFWSLALLVNLTIVAPIFYWMRIRTLGTEEQA